MGSKEDDLRLVLSSTDTDEYEYVNVSTRSEPDYYYYDADSKDIKKPLASHREESRSSVRLHSEHESGASSRMSSLYLGTGKSSKRTPSLHRKISKAKKIKSVNSWSYQEKSCYYKKSDSSKKILSKSCKDKRASTLTQNLKSKSIRSSGDKRKKDENRYFMNGGSTSERFDNNSRHRRDFEADSEHSPLIDDEDLEPSVSKILQNILPKRSGRGGYEKLKSESMKSKKKWRVGKNKMLKTASDCNDNSQVPSTRNLKYFKPRQDQELPVHGYSMCRICKSYYPDSEGRRNHHLSQHPERIFLVNLPVDTYYFDIEEVITHLAKFGINRTVLQQKVRDCSLIKLPTNLKGYSCALCMLLDTNSVEDFMNHVKVECKVSKKGDRAQHLVCFCRGCHSRFADEVELSTHVNKRSCWPDMMLVNELYDQCEKVVVSKDREANYMRANQKILNMVASNEQHAGIHREGRVASLFNGYKVGNRPLSPLEFPSHSYLKSILQNVKNDFSVPPPPPVPFNPSINKNQLQEPRSNSSNIHAVDLNLSAPPPRSSFPSKTNINVLSQPHQVSSSNLATKELNNESILLDQSVTSQVDNYSISSIKSDMSLLNTSASLSVRSDLFCPDNSHTTASIRSDISLSMEKEQGLSFSSLGLTRLQSSAGMSKKSDSSGLGSMLRKHGFPIVAPPKPSTPIHTIGSLFTFDGSSREKSTAASSISSGTGIIKNVSALNCTWSRCLWTDSHTPTCGKSEILARCGSDQCNWYSKHRDYPICDKLSFFCNCKRLDNGLFKYYDDMPQVVKIPTCVDGPRNIPVKESKNISMRLLYMRKSRVVDDPRLSKLSYPKAASIQHSGSNSYKLIPSNEIDGSWMKNIYTWYAVSLGKVKVVKNNNPHIVNDDRDSDVEELPSNGDLSVLSSLDVKIKIL